MADEKSRNQLERQEEAWIDSVQRALNAQTELFVSGLRLWRRLGVAFVQGSAGVTQVAATVTARSATETASNVREATGKATELITEPLAEATRRARQRAHGPQHGVGLDALTVEQLDRLASTNNIDDYPQTGAKREKVTALAAAGLSLDALSVEHLDRLATTNNVEDYPQTGSKGEKIAALEAAEVAVTSAN
jgi:hypothetical protein